MHFVDIRLKHLGPVSLEAVGGDSNQDEQGGIIHYKYFPRTGEWGTAEVSYLTLTPVGGGRGRLIEALKGEGTVDFH